MCARPPVAVQEMHTHFLRGGAFFSALLGTNLQKKISRKCVKMHFQRHLRDILSPPQIAVQFVRIISL